MVGAPSYRETWIRPCILTSWLTRRLIVAELDLVFDPAPAFQHTERSAALVFINGGIGALLVHVVLHRVTST